ncbi:hypothetical protein C4573_00165 [Candidatus Woesearchaeota archaeon]|nr:MAG: hypothetical protein C4573_00165 [Candidatus Woesearchaeota archaeon]
MNPLALGFFISAIFLIYIGSRILKSWEKNYREALFYWGFGLMVWGAAMAMQSLLTAEIIPSTKTLLFIRFHLEGIAFVFFLLYGTLMLILKKKQATAITLTYYLFFFVSSIFLVGTLKNITAVSVWHNVLFITPPSLLFGFYYFYYYKLLKTTKIFSLYNLWIFFAVLAYMYTFTFAFGLLESKLFSVWSILYNAVVLGICFSYLSLTSQANIAWNQITKPLDHIVDHGVLELFEKYFQEKGKDIIQELLAQTGIAELKTASKQQRTDFIEKALQNYFSDVISVQKQDIIRTQLIGLLGMSVEDSYWKSYNYSAVRM